MLGWVRILDRGPEISPWEDFLPFFLSLLDEKYEKKKIERMLFLLFSLKWNVALAGTL